MMLGHDSNPGSCEQAALLAEVVPVTTKAAGAGSSKVAVNQDQGAACYCCQMLVR
jgi:hypothetical protein